MDDLDLILLDAWNRLGSHCKRDRLEALRRSKRRFQKMIHRPFREWCLVIRASDTRINKDNGAIVDDLAVASNIPHTVWMDGSLIRELTKPVIIDWPGVTFDEAARRLGREYDSLREWVRQGAFRIERYREYGFPEHGRRRGSQRGTFNCERDATAPSDSPPPPDASPPPDSHQNHQSRDDANAAGVIDEQRVAWNERLTGAGRPYIWSPSPIDPNNFHGRAPHPVWGTLWQSLWQCLPEDFAMEVERVPRYRSWDGRTQFMGWYFVCPGRCDENGQPRGCGKLATYLYGPQTV